MSTPRRASTWRANEFAGNARFELRQVLGEGSMGTVYEAFDRERDMAVALKTVHELDAHGLYRLKTEFRARADLEHRNLVRLGELYQDDQHWFFTMELVEGWPFLDWSRRPTGRSRSRRGCAIRSASSRWGSRSSIAAARSTAISSRRTCSSPRRGGS
ncbi:MAG: protein kinase [Kofleriaceae bacterium]